MRCLPGRLCAMGALLAASLLLARAGASFEEGARADAPVHLLAVGDILLGDASQEFLDRHGYAAPFARVRRYLAGADLLVGNLEGPITEYPYPITREKAYIYRSRPAAARALRRAGFDLLCLANNHTLDYRLPGLLDTLSHLERAGLGHFGAGRDREQAVAGAIVERGGMRIGFLGFMEPFPSYANRFRWFADETGGGVARMDPQTMRAAFAAMRPNVDLLVASFHWGQNYAPVTPTQRAYGRLAVEYGADLVVGHHPHVAQGVEVYRGVPILYSVGNFTFGTPGRFRSAPALMRYSWLADVTLAGGRVVTVDLLPLEVDNRRVRFQPYVADRRVLPRLLRSVNRPFGTRMEVAGNRARLRLLGNAGTDPVSSLPGRGTSMPDNGGTKWASLLQRIRW